MIVRIETPPTAESDRHTLVKNTMSMFLGQGARLIIQAAYFILMARNLGSQQYGAFVAVTAAASIAYPFVGNGSGSLLIKNVSRDPQVFAEYWGNALLITLASGLVLSFGVLAACVGLLPHTIPFLVILFVILSDVLVYRFVDIAGMAFQSVEMLGWTARLYVFASFTRLVGIASIVILQRPTLLAWSLAYLLASMASAIVALACVVRRLGAPRLGLHRICGELREGFYFSAGLSAQTIYNDLDKTMLARIATLDAAGIYAAAYRLIDVAFVPVRSLLAAAYPSFFRSGRSGLASSLSFAKRLLPRPIAYSLAVAISLLVAAPLVPAILGAEYARTTEAARWLAVLPLLKTLHYFAADSLTGAGFQGLRTLAQVFVAAFNVLMNLWLIPMYSWRGAAWSSVASDALLVVSLYAAVILLSSRRESKRPPPVAVAVSPIEDLVGPG
jgi:O-antigen/teichoic acid export membrane protein